MDDRANHRQQRHRRRQRGKFAFIGETENWDRGNCVPEPAPSEFETKQIFPLSTTQVGDRVVIQKILTSQNMIHRLRKMGLTQGSEGEVISHRQSGSVIIGIQEDSIGLAAGIAHQVMVTLVVEEASNQAGSDSNFNQFI
jgi:Fe2+ transport system protein FeoA